MRGSAAFRTSVTPGGALAGPWVRNPLWNAARSVPSLDLRFADNKSLVDATTGQNLVTFTRASSGTYVDSQGVIRTATTNEVRFDHNPTTGESLGLLVEESRTNLLLQSEDLSTTWGSTNYTVITNATTAPNGTITADKLIRNTIDTSTPVTQNVTVTANTAYNYSVFVKASEWSKVGLREGSVSGNYVTFDLSNGTIVSSSVATGAITAFANGWYRISMQMTTSGAQTTYGVRLTPLPDSYTSGTPSYSFAGDGTSGLFAWGAQLEQGAFPTSYIPTTTAAVTRSADVASISGSNFSSWFNAIEGSFFSQSSVLSTAAYTGRIYTSGVGTDNISAFRQSDFQPVLRFRVSNTDQALFGFGATWTDSLPRRLGQSYRVDDFAGVVNGGSVSADTSGTLPTVSALSIGSQDSASFFNGHIRRLTYWPQRLPNATLQTITQ